jgi:hypothetical protein
MGARTLLRRAIGVAALTTAVVGVGAGVAAASPVPPTADASLLGTWVNTNPNTGSVREVVVLPNRDGGNVLVDAFGACEPTSCEWGAVPAIVYGPNVSAQTGTTFQTNQGFLSGNTEWSRTTLLGNVTKTVTGGLKLTLNELTIFEDGSGRKNYSVTETFVRGEGQKPTKLGLSVTGYNRGNPPLLGAGAFGAWVPTGGNNLAEVDITNTGAFPVVHAFGACSPTPCDWGVSRAISYGPNISQPVGRVALAPYSFGFKKAQLVITYKPLVKRLVVSVYNEFTDGSGRSNYVVTQTFVRK